MPRTAPNDDADLRDRYRPMPLHLRLVLLVLAGLLVGGLLGWLGWATLTNSSPPADSTIVGFDIVDDHTATATVRLKVDDEAEDVRCRVRAFAEDKSIVGEVAWSPKPGARGEKEIEIATERRATAVESVGCTAKGQPRPR